MKLIIFSGLPCTGKSSLSEIVGRRLRIPVFSKDWLEAAFRHTGIDKIVSGQLMGYTGYEILTTLARRQLELGQSAILDSVAGLESSHVRWRQLAGTHQANWYVIECICSDKKIHRARLATRRPFFGKQALRWPDIDRVKARYEPWQDKRLTLDAVHPLDKNIKLALAYLDDSPIDKKLFVAE